MDLFKTTPNFDFMGKRKLALGGSVILIIAALVSIAVKGFNLGIDFTGGTVIEVGYPQAADLNQVRARLEQGGFGDATALHYGSAKEVLVRLPPREGLDKAEISNQVLAALGAGTDAEADAPKMRRVEFVGPQIGKELVEDGGLALLYAFIGILIYVALRFEYRLALASVVATLHDFLITLGLISMLGLQFDLTMMAAILTVIGYSINDTIVVFDRIRENFRKLRQVIPVQVMNLSVNETLTRTLVTGPTTLFVLATLYVLGGQVIQDFALALIIGVVIGTFSSIYVASPVALLLGVSKGDLMPVAKEGLDDGRP